MMEAKEQAKSLRTTLAQNGEMIGHAQSLERIAKSFGFRDWNTLSKTLKDTAPANWIVGARVTGHYLSQPFEATIVSVRPDSLDWVRIAIDLDEPVDVVTFDSFSSLRKRVNAVIGPKGHTKERTSNGHPQLQIHLLR
jgi:hypothetical protein